MAAIEPENVSIIIPHYNGIQILIQCLNSLYTTDAAAAEIVLVDNASTDGSADYVQSHYPDVRIISSPNNLGYAGGCNLGAQHASGDYLVFLNNDTIQAKDWLQPLLRRLGEDPQIAAVQPKIRNLVDQSKFDYAGGAGGGIDIFVIPFARGRIMDEVEIDSGQYNSPTEIFWASGTAFITRSDIFHNSGGFDELLFAHMEEIDFCWKCHLQGFRVVYEPKSVIFHRGGSTLAYFSPRKTYLNHRNSILLLLTNYYPLYALTVFPLRLIMEFGSILKDMFTGRWKHVLAQVRALGWILFHPHRIYGRYRKTKALRVRSDNDLRTHMYRSSILWAHLVERRRTYSDLNPRLLGEKELNS